VFVKFRTEMKLTIHPSTNKEVLVQRWQRQLYGRTNVNFLELNYLFRQRVSKNH